MVSAGNRDPRVSIIGLWGQAYEVILRTLYIQSGALHHVCAHTCRYHNILRRARETSREALSRQRGRSSKNHVQEHSHMCMFRTKYMLHAEYMQPEV